MSTGGREARRLPPIGDICWLLQHIIRIISACKDFNLQLSISLKRNLFVTIKATRKSPCSNAQLYSPPNESVQPHLFMEMHGWQFHYSPWMSWKPKVAPAGLQERGRAEGCEQTSMETKTDDTHTDAHTCSHRRNESKRRTGGRTLRWNAWWNKQMGKATREQVNWNKWLYKCERNRVQEY